MQVTSYCEKLIMELNGWREKADAIVGELDNMPSYQKKEVAPQVIELHMFVEELSDRIERVKRKCSEALESDEVGVPLVKAHTIGNWED